MKKLVFLVLMAVISLGTYAQTQKGDQSAGFNLGYGFDKKNMTIGVDYRYNLTDAIRLAPSLTYFTKNDGLSAFAIDVNAHYVVKLSDMFGFYPLAGVDLSFWDANKLNKTRFGVNLGLGAELYATQRLTVGLEAKYNIIKDFDQAILAIRIGYNF